NQLSSRLPASFIVDGSVRVALSDLTTFENSATFDSNFSDGATDPVAGNRVVTDPGLLAGSNTSFVAPHPGVAIETPNGRSDPPSSMATDLFGTCRVEGAVVGADESPAIDVW